MNPTLVIHPHHHHVLSLLILALGLLWPTVSWPGDPFVRRPTLPTSATTSWFPSWGDYDNDGDIDLAVANGAASSTANGIDLYRNRGDGTFERMTATQVGDVASIAASWGTVAWADIDDDGFLDLLATASPWAGGVFRPASVFRNQQDGTFRLIASGDLSGTTLGLWMTPPADWNGDGSLDVLAGVDDGPAGLHLYLNRGLGTFDRIPDSVFSTEKLIPNLNFWADYDLDGDLDVFVPDLSNKQRQDLLFRNEGGGRFTVIKDWPMLQTPQYTWHGAWGDYDQDGDFDCLLIKSGPPLLFRNDGGTFTPADIGLPATGGGAYWLDFDNDALVDLYLERGQGWADTNSLLRNLGDGTYEHVASVLTSRARRQGSAWGDIDNDGFLDVVEVIPTGGTRLFRNQGNAHHWLKLQLRGRSSNTHGIGAVVKVRVTLDGHSVWQMQQVGGTLVAQSDLRPNFGLRDASKADEVIIVWPSGNVQILENVSANQILTVTEPVLFNPARPMATVNGRVAINHLGTATARQWYFLGEPLPGETGESLVLPKAERSHAGRYSVVAQTGTGPVTNHIHLRVDGTFTKIVEGDIVTEEFGSDNAVWFDMDNDGWLDVFVPHDWDVRGLADSLFRNRQDGTFTRILDSPLTVRTRGTTIASAADFNNDGLVDLFVNRADGNGELFRNQGGGQFSAVPGPFNTPHGQGFASSWGDYDRDGDLDLLVAYGYAGNNETSPESLYRNNGDGTFTELQAAAVGTLLSDRFATWTCALSDLDNDGWPDALVQHLSGLRLHRNNRDGTFSRITYGSLANARTDDMFTLGDYDNDGDLDILATRLGNGTAGIHRNQGQFHFEFVSAAGDLTSAKLSSECYPTWGDFDNDGWLDLFIAGYSTPSLLFRNRGDGTFQAVDAGNLLSDGVRRGFPLWVDYDNNGFLDLMLTCGDAVLDGMPGVPNHLYRNAGNGNRWLKVKLVGTTSNRDGVGAKVRVTARIHGRTFDQMREIAGYAGWVGTVPLMAHFGLGDAVRVSKVRIEWPSGIVQELNYVAANQMLTITEPERIQLTCTHTEGGLQITCRGLPNTTYELQWSLNLKTWATQQSLSPTDAQGEVMLVLPESPENCFYRVRKH
jgi:hypothetical protein